MKWGIFCYIKEVYIIWKIRKVNCAHFMYQIPIPQRFCVVPADLLMASIATESYDGSTYLNTNLNNLVDILSGCEILTFYWSI